MKKTNTDAVFLFGSGDQCTRQNYAMYDRRVRPEKDREAQVQARKWQGENPYLQTFQTIELSFYHHGFRVVPEEGKQTDDYKKWWKKNRDEIKAFALAIWREWRTLDVAVSYWRRGVSPFTLDPERCIYTDEMAVETLEYEHRLTSAQVNQLRTPAEKAAFRNPTRKVGSLPGEEFKVLKMARVGAGFGKPRMYSIFRALGQYESLEVSEALMAFFSRLIERRHSMGYEPKSSNSAPASMKWRMFRQERWDDMKRFYKDLTGAVETGTNFDHKTAFIHPPVEFFNDDKWQGIQRRLIWWSGPVGWMLIARGMTPFLMEIFQQETQHQRDLVGGHLNHVINAAWTPPMPVEVRWSNRCFRDPRLASDMMKWGVQQGPLSVTTFMEEGGFDPEQEAERKIREAEADPRTMEPLVDQAHGKMKGERGRPRGSRDDDNAPGMR